MGYAAEFLALPPLVEIKIATALKSSEYQNIEYK